MKVNEAQFEKLQREFASCGIVEIKPRKGRAIGMVVLCLFILLIGYGMWDSADRLKYTIGGILVMLAAVAGIWFSVRRIVGPGTSIVIDREGVTRKTYKILWPEIASTGVFTIEKQQFPCVQLTEEGLQRMQAEAGLFQVMSFGDVERVVNLHNHMAVSPATVCAIVDHARQQASVQR